MFHTRIPEIEAETDAWKSRSFSGSDALHYLMFHSNQYAQAFGASDVDGNGGAAFEAFTEELWTDAGIAADLVMPMAIKAVSSFLDVVDRDFVSPYEIAAWTAAISVLH